jgi:disulfide bond formation protein DsbB
MLYTESMTPQLYTFSVVRFLSVLTLVGQVIALLLIFLLLTGTWRSVLQWVQKNGLWLMLTVAITATLGSLFLSEIAGWNPCKLCWLQRIFMYPQVVLLIIAAWKRDRTVARYIVALSVIGLLLASYHYYIQMYDIVVPPAAPAVPCDESGESCARTPFLHLGYITIPLMAWTAFLLNLLGSVVLIRRSR